MRSKKFPSVGEPAARAASVVRLFGAMNSLSGEVRHFTGNLRDQRGKLTECVHVPFGGVQRFNQPFLEGIESGSTNPYVGYYLLLLLIINYLIRIVTCNILLK